MSKIAHVLLTTGRLLMRAFFRRIEVTGLDNVPKQGGGVLIAAHPNGVVDPALLITHFPRRLVFGARHGLLEAPVFGAILNALGTVPIYRAVDGEDLSVEERRARNASSLDALAERVAQGSYSALFPEGESHDLPHLMQIRTGAARFYYQARAMRPPDQPVPVILPVGLHYDNKRIFRTDVLISIHPPLELPPELDVDPPDNDPDARARMHALRDVIEERLRSVAHATESWEVHQLMHRAQSLMRAERSHRAGEKLDPAELSERVLGMARIWHGYETRRETHPQLCEQVMERVRSYDQDLTALGLHDAELDHPPKLADPWLFGLMLAQLVCLVTLVPPLLGVGYVVNWLPTALVWLGSKVLKKAYKDEASIKIMVGSVAYPLTWIGSGFLAARAAEALNRYFPTLPDAPYLAGITVAVLGAVGGMALLRYMRVTRATLRAVRVRLTRSRRKEALDHLRLERAALHDALADLGRDLELPGNVQDDGRIDPR